jgi:glycine cleavage system H protein
MINYMELKIDKFIFRVAEDRLYTPFGIWVLEEGDLVRIGLSDFLQQRSGDIAFVEIKLPGTQLAPGDEFGAIETIKVNISLDSPLTGQVVETNPAIESTPELINQEPYGSGWVALIKPERWTAEKAGLLDPQAYFSRIKHEAEMEA